MSEQDKIELVKKIQLAFKNVKHPGRNIGDTFELRDWISKASKDVTISDINGNWSIRSFSPEAVQYFLPIYLIAILQKPSEVGQNIKESLLEDLTSYTSSKGDLCDILTDKQKQVVFEFVKRYLDFFPLRTPQQMQQLPPGHRKPAKVRDAKLQNLVTEAIRYWNGCVGGSP